MMDILKSGKKLRTGHAKRPPVRGDYYSLYAWLYGAHQLVSTSTVLDYGYFDNRGNVLWVETRNTIYIVELI